jgi:cold shock CspA family protein
MARGTVKWFSDHRGYGFISSEGAQEVYVHHSSIEGNGFRRCTRESKSNSISSQASEARRLPTSFA